MIRTHHRQESILASNIDPRISEPGDLETLNSEVLTASPQHPCVGLVMKLDVSRPPVRDRTQP